MQILEMKDEEFYEGMGMFFVKLTQELKFDKFILIGEASEADIPTELSEVR